MKDVAPDTLLRDALAHADAAVRRRGSASDQALAIAAHRVLLEGSTEHVEALAKGLAGLMASADGEVLHTESPDIYRVIRDLLVRLEAEAEGGHDDAIVRFLRLDAGAVRQFLQWLKIREGAGRSTSFGEAVAFLAGHTQRPEFMLDSASALDLVFPVPEGGSTVFILSGRGRRAATGAFRAVQGERAEIPQA